MSGFISASFQRSADLEKFLPELGDRRAHHAKVGGDPRHFGCDPLLRGIASDPLAKTGLLPIVSFEFMDETQFRRIPLRPIVVCHGPPLWLQRCVPIGSGKDRRRSRCPLVLGSESLVRRRRIDGVHPRRCLRNVEPIAAYVGRVDPGQGAVPLSALEKLTDAVEAEARRKRAAGEGPGLEGCCSGAVPLSGAPAPRGGRRRLSPESVPAPRLQRIDIRELLRRSSRLLARHGGLILGSDPGWCVAGGVAVQWICLGGVP